ncbi:HAD domain-containing protein [Ideonella sp. B508-1]|uniref:HAD domain-containing protein n=1 Tax=Ideonella sp. B508-1 TaxID=137716 RepID=UPI00034A2132|nr:HAD domain-containing protein [Ideonella sp. B508-1]
MLGDILASMGFGAKWLAGTGFARETQTVPPSPSRSDKQPNGHLSRTPARRVLMLDIDGVLHPAQSGSPIYLPLLEAWLREHRCVDVVVSSNWKNTHTVEQLRQFFSVDLRDRVLGTTPDCRGVREDQILELVERHDIELWGAVDNREDGFPTTAAMHLAKTEYFDGLVPATFTRLAWILQL